MRTSPLRWRVLTAVLLAVTALTLSATTSTAAAAPRHSVVTVGLEPAGAPVEATAIGPAAATGAGALLDPPMGGCYLGNLGGNVTGYYTNGVLTRTESTFFSSIDCTVTAPGQSMENLWDMASINLSAGGSGRGTIGNCDFPNENMTPCVSVRSTGTWTCPIGIRCAGEYWVDSETFMTLPSGWYWATLPADCTLLSSRQISCLIETGTVTVPPYL